MYIAVCCAHDAIEAGDVAGVVHEQMAAVRCGDDTSACHQHFAKDTQLLQLPCQHVTHHERCWHQPQEHQGCGHDCSITAHGTRGERQQQRVQSYHKNSREPADRTQRCCVHPSVPDGDLCAPDNSPNAGEIVQASILHLLLCQPFVWGIAAQFTMLKAISL